jgi:hypothetical protein
LHIGVCGVRFGVDGGDGGEEACVVVVEGLKVGVMVLGIVECKQGIIWREHSRFIEGIAFHDAGHLELCECHVRCSLVAGVEPLCVTTAVYSSARDCRLLSIVGASSVYVVSNLWFSLHYLKL